MEEALTPPVNYAEAIRRRLPLGLLVGLAVVVITVAVALGLPAIYKSRGILLIEKQDIPEDLVRSLVTSYADQRIQVISQRVLTTANLVAIIEKFGLYADERATDPIEVIVEQMREDITVEPISADVVDDRGRATKATIAVEIAFDSKDPNTAQRVANDLVSLYLNENLKQRTEAADETLTFLTEEAERLRNDVAELELKHAEFKELNAGALPELASLNLQLMSRTEQELLQVQNQIASLEQQRVYLESELAQQSPSGAILMSETGERLMSPTDRLKSLESQYITLTARYGENHPDVVTMRREIDTLRKQTGAPVPASELAARLQSLEAERAAARERYGDEHPDIRRLDREIAALERGLANTGSNGAPTPAEIRPDNPAYIQLQARLDATNSDLRSLQNQQAAMRAKLEDFERRLSTAPQVEREYRALNRDYETALAKYQEVLAKRQEAQLARSLESEQKGERFTLIEPPRVPEEPDRPNRLAIGFLGVILAAAGSVGAGAMAESLDTRIYGRTGVTRLTGVPPLAVIPQLDNAATRRARLRKRLLLAAAGLGAIALALFLVHITLGPLDVLYYRALRVLGF
ncbi:MAG: lipopolysaccharide biosynthesis protein [Gammaproteobacteria bacterium]